MSRTQAREDAFKIIYNINVSKDRPESAIAYLCETVGKDTSLWSEEILTKNALIYIQSVVNGVFDNQGSINSCIEPKLNKGNIERLAFTTLSILQLAAYEILYMDDIPNKVTANEAVNLAKKYCDETTAKFVNGVIGRIIEESNKTEEVK